MNFNFDEMSFDEIKEVAKQNGIKFGNISKDNLVEKIKDILCKDEATVGNSAQTKSETSSPLSSIMAAIDDMDESDADYANGVVEKLPMNANIPVRSLTFGTLIYKSPLNNATFVWNKIGATIYMTVEEITQMNNQHENFLRKPLVVLLDERAVKHFGLTSVYENVAKINDLGRLFKSDMKTISKTIDDALQVNMRDILISKVRDMYKKKKLTDINIIRLLEKRLQFDLSEDN